MAIDTMNGRAKIGFLTFTMLLCAGIAACGGATPADSPSGEAPNLTTRPPATPLPAADLMSGPLVGFYVEDLYEDVYLSIYDAGTGGLRVLYSGVPIYVGEAQWSDDGCRLFVHGQLTDLHGAPQWSIPPEAADQVDHLDTAKLAPDRGYLAHIVSSGLQTGTGAAAADIEVVSLSPPYPAIRLTVRGGGEPRALAWSADGAWLYFTDYDESGLLQIYRAAAGGSTAEQLTLHDGAIGAINGLAPSPNGRYVAYSVQNLMQTAHPYNYQPADEGWVGILDLVAWTSAQVRPAKFSSAEPGRGLIWDPAGERLVIIGDSLPVAADDPAAGRQVHWATATGEVTRSLATMDGPDGPGGHLGWIAPLGNIDTLLVGVQDAFYVHTAEGFRRLEEGEAPPLGMALGRRPIGILPAPVGFPGEEACGR